MLGKGFTNSVMNAGEGEDARKNLYGKRWTPPTNAVLHPFRGLHMILRYSRFDSGQNKIKEKFIRS